jgi:hypothetical protein
VAVTDRCFALAQTFKTEDIITHWMMSPGRKIMRGGPSVLRHVPAAALGAGFGGILPDAQDHDLQRAARSPSHLSCTVGACRTGGVAAEMANGPFNAPLAADGNT